MFAAQQLGLLGKCGGPGEIACTDMCLCEVTQATGADLDSCQNSLDPAAFEGWCYIDPANGISASELVNYCPEGQQRLLRVPVLDAGTILAVCSTSASAVDSQAIATPGALGDFCMPPDEYSTAFSGFDDGETNVATGYAGCESGICLVHHFRGRASCPYGSEFGTTCETPAGEPVTALVRAQLLERPPEDAILCSCQCGGPNPDAKYCACPTGFECREMVPDFPELGQSGASYCIKEGTYVADPELLNPATCSFQALNCESP